MLPNIEQALYAKFKGAYRLKAYRRAPVRSIAEIVNLGYLDVNRTLQGIDTEQRRFLKEAVVVSLEEMLTKPPAKQRDFDEFHRKCCQQCLKVDSAGGARIHYGQAQKLLNMSLKYLYNEFAAYYGKVNHFNFPDNNVEYFFHLPVDLQIRNHLVIRCRFADPTSLPWSQWSYDHYISFQSQLRRRISRKYKPLEIDYLVWNTQGASVRDAIMSC